MQPYIFPYIGYFQLINAVDLFVFYDDVNHIKRGWIHRNRILLNGKEYFLTVPCFKSSQNKFINEIEFNSQSKEYKNLLRTLELAYKRAPFFTDCFPIIESVFKTNTNKIAVLAEESVKAICFYIDLIKKFDRSSVNFSETKGLEKADRLISICKKAGGKNYINPIGGSDLYRKEYFSSKGIDLKFIKPESEIYYTQALTDKFVPWLSIIDVIMYNSKNEVKNMLNKYILE